MQTLVGVSRMPKFVTAEPVDEVAYERELVRRIRANDRAAAEELVDLNYAAVFASLVKLTGDTDLAADLTQETFRKAWQSFGSFRGKSRVFTWLYRIAYTTFLNVRRRPDVVLNLPDEKIPEPVDSEILSDQRVVLDDDQQELREAVLRLDDKDRFVVTAHYWGDLSLPEIAKLEGVSAVAIRKRLAKAHDRIHAMMEESR